MDSAHKKIKVRSLLIASGLLFIVGLLGLTACSFAGQAASAASSKASTIQESAQNQMNQPSQEAMLENTFAIYIGNSFTAGVGSSTGHSGIYELTKDMFQDSRCFISMGAGLIDYEGQGGEDNYVDLLQRAVDDGTFDNAQVTHIFFVGARGDCWARNKLDDDAVWLEGMHDSLVQIDEIINASFPNAKYCGYVWADAFKDLNSASEKQKTYCTYTVNELMPEMLNGTRLQYMGWIGWDILFDRECFAADGAHPNDAGYQRLAHDFKSALFGNFVCQPKICQMNNPLSQLSSEGVAADSSESIRLTSTPDGLYVWFPPYYKSAGVGFAQSTEMLDSEYLAGTAEGIPIKTDGLLGDQGASGSLDIGTMKLVLSREEKNGFQSYAIGVSLVCSETGTSLVLKPIANGAIQGELPGPAGYDYLIGNSMMYPYVWR